jgi:hypothetical protein
MSDVESMYLDSAENLCTGMNSSDNEDAIESQQYPKQEALKIFSNNNTFEQQSSSLSSSVSSTSSSSSYLSITTSSPYTTNKNNNFSYFSSPTCKETPSQHPIDRSQSAQDFLNQYNQMWKYTPTHYSSTSLPSSNHLTSTTSSSNINERNNNATNFVAVALYNNPYLVMNLLQSQQNMALQAALKASLTHSHQVNNEYTTSYLQQQQQSSSNAVAAPTTPVIKRKTHLSNCFMQDLSKEGGRFEAFRGEDELELKSCLYDATNKSNNFELTQQHVVKFENGQNGPTFHNQENKQPLVRKTKINFGDISELIN